MKRAIFPLLFFILQFSTPGLFAQQSDTEVDSVWVEGRVTNALTEQADTNCEVQLLQEGDIKAVAVSDSDGYFSIGWMPTGTYTLSVTSNGKSLYYTEFLLNQSAMLAIALMPDTVNSRILHPAEITASRLQPVYKPITSPDDPRLWNWHGNPFLMDSGPASSASGCPNGRAPFFKPGSLASWRPAWLDAPFPKPQKNATKKTQENEKKE